MATKAELEKELKEARAALTTSETEAKGLLQKLGKAEDTVESLAGELAGLKARKDEGLVLPGDHKAQLRRLEIFIGKLYRESEHPGVRQDILDWRKLLATLVGE